MCSPTGVASMKPFSDLFVSASVVAEAWQVFGAASCLDSVWCGAHGAQRSYRGTQRPVRCIPLRIWVIYTCNIYIIYMGYTDIPPMIYGKKWNIPTYIWDEIWLMWIIN